MSILPPRRLPMIFATFLWITGCTSQPPKAAERPSFRHVSEAYVDRLLKKAQVELLELSDYRDYALGEMARAWARAGRMGEALKALHSMADDRDQLRSHVQVVEGLAESGDREAAREVIRLGLESARKGEGAFSFPTAFSSMAEAAATIGLVDWALEILYEAKKRETSIYYVCEVAKLAAQQGRTEVAEWLADKKDGPNDLDRILEDAARELLKRGELERVAEIALSIKDNRWYQREILLQLVRTLINSRREPSGFRLGSLEEAVHVTNHMPDSSIKAEALAEIADFQWRHCEKEGAIACHARIEQILAGLTKPFDRVEALVASARLWARRGDVRKTRDYLQEAELALDPVRDWKAFGSTLGEVMGAYVGAGLSNVAFERILGLEDFDQAECLRAMACEFAKLGDLDAAMAALERVSWFRDRAWGYFDLARLPPLSERTDLRRRFLRRSLEIMIPERMCTGMGSGFDWEDEYTLMIGLVEAQGSLGDFEGSWMSAGKIFHEKDEHLGAFAYGDAARIQAKGGDLEGAEKRIARLKSPLARALALVGAAEGMLLRFR